MRVQKSSFYLLVESLLQEGVYDPSIFKAVFMGGGPGSGKGFSSVAVGLAASGGMGSGPAYLTYDDIIGREIRQAINTTSSYGLKVVNIDDVSNYVNLKAGLGTLDPKSNQISMDYEYLKQYDKPAYDQSQDLRTNRAKPMHAQRLELYKELGLGLLIDQTSSDYGKVWQMKADLEDIGYDCAMLFVKMPRDLAWELNIARKANGQQSVAEADFHRIWDEIDENAGAFESLFSPFYWEVTNYGPGYALEGKSEAEKAIRSFLSQPPTNPDVRDWIEWMTSNG